MKFHDRERAEVPISPVSSGGGRRLGVEGAAPKVSSRWLRTSASRQSERTCACTPKCWWTVAELLGMMRRVSMEANKAVVERWVAVTNEKDLASLDELFTDDTFDNVGQRAGVDWWKEVFGFLYRTLPDWHWTLDGLIVEGDKVVARLTVVGPHLGSDIPFLRGIEPTGRRVVWTHHHTFRFIDGRIAEHWANRDDLGFLRQVTGS